jgi:hypothetical protein
MSIAFVALLVVLPRVAEAQWPNQLTAADSARIEEGQVLVLERDVTNAPWPRVRLYRFIDATPEQSAAMLTDYEHQPMYSHDLKEARVVQKLGSARTHVFFRYASNVPLISDVTYTVFHRIRHDTTDVYRVEWSLIEGSKVKYIEGSARFSPWVKSMSANGGTLLTYDNFVIPAFPLAGLAFARRKGMDAMRDAVNAIAVEVARERRDSPTLLDRQVNALRAALAP